MGESLTFTLYRDAFDNQGIVQTKPWAEWIADFTAHRVIGSPSDSPDKEKLNRDKLTGPAVILGKMKGTRSKANVQNVAAMSIDLDGATPTTVERIVYDVLKPFEKVVYTTYKSGSEAIGGLMCLRIILPLDRAHGAAVHPKAWAALNTVIGGHNDGGTKDCSRLNLLPATFDMAHTAATHFAGRRLSYESDLKNVTPVELFSAKNESDVGTGGLCSEVTRFLSSRTNGTLSYAAEGRLLARGEPFAEPGSRHQTILGLTMVIARKFPTLSEDQITSIFEPSLDAMSHDQNSEDEPTDEEIWTAYAGAVDKVYDGKFSRDLYDDETLETMMELHRIPNADALDRCWILIRQKAYYVLTADRGYQGPYIEKECNAVYERLLDRAPIDLYTITDNGPRLKTLGTLCREYGTVVRQIVVDMTAQTSTFDYPKLLINEASCPIRKFEPVYHKDIDEWLQALCGKHYPKIVNWLACFPDLQKMLCILYFSGKENTGKSLFLSGIAHLFSDSPASADEIFGTQFNESLTRCPVIAAEEELPKSFVRTTTTTLMRQICTQMTRPLTRKNLPSSVMRGAVRLVLTANNDRLISSGEIASNNDIKAIASRVLFIRTGRAAQDIMKSMQKEDRGKPIEQQRTWQWANTKIPQHVTYLAQNVEVKKSDSDEQGRLWVNGEVDDVIRLIVFGHFPNRMVIEWIARFLDHPKPNELMRNLAVRVENGHLYLNESAILKSWDQLMDHMRHVELDQTNISTALSIIGRTDAPDRIEKWVDKKPVRMVDVDLSYVYAWADRCGFNSKTMKNFMKGAVVFDPSRKRVEGEAKVGESAKEI